jgi:hypothetical protein
VPHSSRVENRAMGEIDGRPGELMRRQHTYFSQ